MNLIVKIDLKKQKTKKNIQNQQIKLWLEYKEFLLFLCKIE